MLGSNYILSEGAIYVSEILIGNKMLISLDLSNNKFSSKGTVALAESLKSNNTLQILNLSMIDTYYSLNLEGNKCGVDGINAFISTFTINKTLISLCLGFYI